MQQNTSLWPTAIRGASVTRYQIITSRFCSPAPCVLFGSGIHLACAVWRKFYEGSMNWFPMPICFPKVPRSFDKDPPPAELRLSGFRDLV